VAKQPYFMVTNRGRSADGLSSRRVDTLSFFTAATGAEIVKLKNWTELSAAQFEKELLRITSAFPLFDDADNTKQKHLSLFVHGYNSSWNDAARRYAQIKRDLFDESELGVLVLYSWPSDGSAAGYLPDREDARDSGQQSADLFVRLHELVLINQRAAADTKDAGRACRAKISVIAHSMGNYVAQKGLAVAARRLNSPQLVTLIHQLAMVAADVDNDIFQTDRPDGEDGSLMANLCYRIGALYTGLDDVLGASAGLKHFGKRRLGRSGLADPTKVWDNVFHQDVSQLIDKRKAIHSAVFDSPRSLVLLEQILRGVDRHHLPS
jgi:esterase/lipase superfamily enzyme